MVVAVVTTTMDMDMEDIMGMEAEVDTASTRDEVAEAVVDLAVAVDEAAVEAVVTLQTKVVTATGLRTQTPVAVRKKGTP